MIISKRKVVKFKLKIVTGIHIGGSKGIYGIGGIDAPVIKNPLNNEPIIPGSSLKGKIRMLLESIETSKSKLIEKAFGPGPKSTNVNNPLTRVIFRDLSLTKESKDLLEERLGEGFYTEVKAENSIEPSKGTAKAPRFIERVPAGTVFEGEFICNYLDEDKDVNYEVLVRKGFSLLENNYLGGSGSRGYGKVKYIEESIEEIKVI